MYARSTAHSADCPPSTQCARAYAFWSRSLADDYLAVSTTLVTECAKLCISATFYALLPASARSHRQLRRNDALLFAAPAFVYFINNNLIFVILTCARTPARHLSFCDCPSPHSTHSLTVRLCSPAQTSTRPLTRSSPRSRPYSPASSSASYSSACSQMYKPSPSYCSRREQQSRSSPSACRSVTKQVSLRTRSARKRPSSAQLSRWSRACSRRLAACTPSCCSRRTARCTRYTCRICCSTAGESSSTRLLSW